MVVMNKTNAPKEVMLLQTSPSFCFVSGYATFRDVLYRV